MSETKFHIEECNNGWLLTINPSDGRNPTVQIGQMISEFKKMMPGHKNDLDNIMEQISTPPQNQKVVFIKFSELLAYMGLLISEDFKNV